MDRLNKYSQVTSSKECALTSGIGKRSVLVNKNGKPAENSESLLRLRTEVEKLSMVGVQVVYYLVDREENVEADALAKKGISIREV